MGESLVLDLQQMASSGKTPLPELLRHAKVVAVKLGLEDAALWIDHEIGGYPGDVELPAYRIVPSELRVMNPYHGWHAVTWGSGGNVQEHFARFHVFYAIAEVVEIASGDGDPRAAITQPEMDVLLQTHASFSHLPAARCFSRSSIVGIVEAVRAKVLNWALELEKRGVLGRGMTFSEEERRGASNVVLEAKKATVHLLVMSANPSTEEHQALDVEKESNRIKKARNGSSLQATIAIEELQDVDIVELAKSLRLHKPMVVHVTGHGNEEGAIVFRDEEGQAFPMNPVGLAKMFVLHKKTLRLIVLNACHSTKLAELLLEDIDFVIGMSRDVDDEAAVLFSQTFYAALFDDASILDAFETSVASLYARYETEADIPTLQCRSGVDPAAVKLFSGT